MLVGNDSSLKLNDSDTVTLEMRAAHKNQEYLAALLTTSDGIVTYDADNDAPTIWTDDPGALTFSNKEIAGQDYTSVQGFANSQVSGYLAV